MLKLITILCVYLFTILTIQIILFHRSMRNLVASKVTYVDEVKALYSHEKYDYFQNVYPSSFLYNVNYGKLYTTQPFALSVEILDLVLDQILGLYNKNCKSNSKVVIMIISHPRNFLLRQDIRRSYGKNRVNFNYEFAENDPNISHCTFFSIGYLDDTQLNEQVDLETHIYEDIIRVPLLEDYRRTAHKIILTYFLLNMLTNTFDFILKTDDDIFLKINQIIPYLSRLKQTDVFIGHKIYFAFAIRDKTNKWHLSYEEHPDRWLGVYLMGSCYVIRRSIIQNLVMLHNHSRMMGMEDVYISNLVKKMGFQITNSPHLYHCNRYFGCKNSYIIDMGLNPITRQYVINSYHDYIVYRM
ncbi:UDP-GalNAc:beta-1,3-N-acetylgalactosaminyltransferase 1 [Thelohanellus kitauei]|uniref:Hexosyltransferase n=1 Tax=Thelohanellus kitauei TaxID=669202 RepID=A0A0C2MRP4_THEKT|nr:UDP-GalNAc:beta-1,3-N-acetylgalactosaminyltransferase 1 [Thelohanellus kitauei]